MPSGNHGSEETSCDVKSALLGCEFCFDAGQTLAHVGDLIEAPDLAMDGGELRAHLGTEGIEFFLDAIDPFFQGVEAPVLRASKRLSTPSKRLSTPSKRLSTPSKRLSTASKRRSIVSRCASTCVNRSPKVLNSGASQVCISVSHGAERYLFRFFYPFHRHCPTIPEVHANE